MYFGRFRPIRGRFRHTRDLAGSVIYVDGSAITSFGRFRHIRGRRGLRPARRSWRAPSSASAPLRYTYTYVHVLIKVHTYIQTYTCIYIYIHLYLCIYTCMYVYIHIYIYIYVYAYIYIYMYLCICTCIYPSYTWTSWETTSASFVEGSIFRKRPAKVSQQSGSQTIPKLICWVDGTHPSTLGFKKI